jgi:hypothetical protein
MLIFIITGLDNRVTMASNFHQRLLFKNAHKTFMVKKLANKKIETKWP